MIRPKKIFVFLIGILIFIPFFSFATSVDDLRSQIQQKQAEIQQLEQQIAAYQAEIKTKKAQESTLAKQIANMQAQIKKLETEIKLTQAKISAATLEIQDLTNNISVKNNEIEKQKNNLAETLRTINEFDQASPLHLVMVNDNFSDFLNQVQFIDNLQQGLQENLNNLKTLKGQLEETKVDIETQKEFLEQFRNELTGKNLVLANQKDEKEDLLATTKNQEKKYQQMLADLQKKRQDIQKEIYGLEDKLRLTIDPSSIPATRSGVLAWPLKGTITQRYGPTAQTGFVNDVYNFHNGIDIDADVGDAVKSAGDGIVKAIGDNGKYAYGKWIAIDHQNGLITLYGHFSGYAVKVGQTVKVGQIIGYAGNTGFSTGAHLHFTVYATTTFSTQQKWYGLLPLGGPINPMNYL